MASIFDFVKEGQKSPPVGLPLSGSSIFEAAKTLPEKKEPTRIESLTAAPLKGAVKGIYEYGEAASFLQNPLFHMLGLGKTSLPSEKMEELTEEIFPTQKKAPERYLERGGKIATYLAGPGKITSKLARGGIATVAGQLAEDLGLGKGTQGLIEVGAFLSPTGAKKYVSSLYAEANNLARGARTPATKLKIGRASCRERV